MTPEDEDPAGGHRRPGEAKPPIPEVDAPEASDIHAVPSDEEATGEKWWPARILDTIGGAIVLLLTIGVTYGVVMRVAGRGVLGLSELAGMAVLVIVLLGAAGMSARDDNVRLEIVDMFAKPRVVNIMSIVSDVITLVVTLVVTYAAFILFLKDMDRGTTMGGELSLSRFWMTGLISFGFAMVSVAVIRKLWREVRRATRTKKEVS